MINPIRSFMRLVSPSPKGPAEGPAAGGRVLLYGNDKTIHGTTQLDIEQDADGNVQAVWFRCMMLPFKATRMEGYRAGMMEGVAVCPGIKLTAVQIEYPEAG